MESHAPPREKRVGADLVWVKPQALEADLSGMESKEGENVGSGHAFGGRDCVGKV